MKRFLAAGSALCLLLALPACSRPAETASPGLFSLRLQLPASLAKDGNRYRRFLARASHLDIVLQRGHEGEERRYAFPPEQWETLALPELGFGDDPRDVLTVKAQVWDRQGDTVRRFPVLAGTKRFHARDFEPGKPALLVVRLALQVRPEEFD